MADVVETRNRLLRRWGALKTERASWISHWQEISTYLLPRSGRFFRTDRDKGNRRHNNIYDNTASRALKVMAAGLMSGATSPARPWFRLQTPDKDLNQLQPVRVWLDDVTQRILDVFSKSNTYRALHQIYLELGSFGTGGSVVLPHYENVIHHYPLTCGEYAIATDWQGNVCTLYREFEKPVSEIVKEFGLKNCSVTIQNLFNQGGAGLDQWFPILHAIEPRADRDPNKKDSKNMAWGSYYFELGGPADKMLRESGFKRFPAVMPRWEVTGGDIYGSSPGMECLGDIKQLQHEQLRKANGIDFQTNPPLQVPTSLKNQDVNRLPGGITYVENQQTGAVKTAFDVNLNLQYLLEDIRDVRQRINSSFFADLFMMIADADVGKMTATEVAARQEEKMLMLGPVLERLNNELLEPLVEIAFDQLQQGGGIPPAPAEMSGMALVVDYIGILAQAQRAIGVNSIDRFLNTMGGVAKFVPDVLDNLDPDKLVSTYSDKTGVPPEIIRNADAVAQLRDARNKAQAAQQQAATMEQASTAAKNLGSAPTGNGSNALQDMMNQFSGYGSPSPAEV